jgi:hypothetical protein
MIQLLVLGYVQTDGYSSTQIIDSLVHEAHFKSTYSWCVTF